jgi:hypothetical protein
VHTFAGAPTLVVEFSGSEQVLLVKEASSTRRAEQWVSEYGKHFDATSAAAHTTSYGRFVVQWGESPSAQQTAVLEGCLNE